MTPGDPDPRDMISQARVALGLPDTARPEAPAIVWEETLAYMRRLADLATFGARHVLDIPVRAFPSLPEMIRMIDKRG